MNKLSNDDKDTKRTIATDPSGKSSQGSKEDWIGRQLRRVFDDALNEPLPNDIMSLLERIDETEHDPNKPTKSSG